MSGYWSTWDEAANWWPPDDTMAELRKGAPHDLTEEDLRRRTEELLHVNRFLSPTPSWRDYWGLAPLSWGGRRRNKLSALGRIDADGNVLPRDFALEVE